MAANHKVGRRGAGRIGPAVPRFPESEVLPRNFPSRVEDAAPDANAIGGMPRGTGGATLFTKAEQGKTRSGRRRRRLTLQISRRSAVSEIKHQTYASWKQERIAALDTAMENR
jgi:hypothetical protein